jgi:hypothetical protein
MNARNIRELIKLARTGKEAQFTQLLFEVVKNEIADSIRPCSRQVYFGAVRPSNLINLASAEEQLTSCFYELREEAEPTKVMGQISNEIKRASPAGSRPPQIELIYAYFARTGTPFKALKVTYNPARTDSVGSC